MLAKQFLKRLGEIDLQISLNCEDIARIKERAMSITSATKDVVVTSSQISDKVGNSVAEYVDKENEKISHLLIERDYMKKLLEKLCENNITSYTIIFSKYVLHKTFKEIAIEINRTYSQVTTAHGRALRDLDIVLQENNYESAKESLS